MKKEKEIYINCPCKKAANGLSIGGPVGSNK
jgi:hypothetical protein